MKSNNTEVKTWIDRYLKTFDCYSDNEAKREAKVKDFARMIDNAAENGNAFDFEAFKHLVETREFLNKGIEEHGHCGL